MEQFLASESCEAIPKYASQYFNHNSVFFIGRNLDYALGLEGSLKLKEISYIHSGPTPPASSSTARSRSSRTARSLSRSAPTPRFSTRP